MRRRLMCKATKCYKSAKAGGAKHTLVGQNGKLVGHRKLRPCGGDKTACSVRPPAEGRLDPIDTDRTNALLAAGGDQCDAPTPPPPPLWLSWGQADWNPLEPGGHRAASGRLRIAEAEGANNNISSVPPIKQGPFVGWSATPFENFE